MVFCAPFLDIVLLVASFLIPLMNSHAVGFSPILCLSVLGHCRVESLHIPHAQTGWTLSSPFVIHLFRGELSFDSPQFRSDDMVQEVPASLSSLRARSRLVVARGFLFYQAWAQGISPRVGLEI